MRGYRVFDTVEKKYCPNGFYLRGDGVLLENVGGAFTSLTPADPKRYIVEEGTEAKGAQYFVGDSVTVWGSDGISINAEILFQDGCFNVQFKNPVYDKLLDTMRVRDYLKVYTSMHSIKVIGTIHNNPELLEETE